MSYSCKFPSLPLKMAAVVGEIEGEVAGRDVGSD